MYYTKCIEQQQFLTIWLVKVRLKQWNSCTASLPHTLWMHWSTSKDPTTKKVVCTLQLHIIRDNWEVSLLWPDFFCPPITLFECFFCACLFELNLRQINRKTHTCPKPWLANPTVQMFYLIRLIPTKYKCNLFMFKAVSDCNAELNWIDRWSHKM